MAIVMRLRQVQHTRHAAWRDLCSCLAGVLLLASSMPGRLHLPLCTPSAGSCTPCPLQEAARESAGMRSDLEALANECVELRRALQDSQAQRQVRVVVQNVGRPHGKSAPRNLQAEAELCAGH